MNQVHIVYRGRVQGVGFRYTVEEIARRQEIKGWIKNLSDGSVEMVAQAQQGQLTGFMDSVHDAFSRYIKDIEVDWSDASVECKDFSIRF